MDHLGLFGSLNPMTSVLIKDSRREDGRRGKGPVKTEAETGALQLEARSAWSHQNLEDARKDSPWSLWREHSLSTH